MAGLLTILLCVLISGCIFPNRNDVPFGSPIVIITFDDAHSSIYTFAYPLIESTDSSWAATHFLPVVHAGGEDMVTVGQLQEMEAAGWETGGAWVYT